MVVREPVVGGADRFGCCPSCYRLCSGSADRRLQQRSWRAQDLSWGPEPRQQTPQRCRSDPGDEREAQPVIEVCSDGAGDDRLASFMHGGG